MTLPGAGSGYVGRELELERLTRRLEDAVDGHGGMVVIRGESGMGTTRTAYEVAARADRLGMVTLWGETVEGLAGRPFGALADALEEFGTSLEPAALRVLLGAGAAALARMCPRLREMLPDIPPAAPLDAPDERLRLYDAVLRWLDRASAERPLLIVLDDFGWADDDARDLVGHLARGLAELPVLVLATQAETPDSRIPDAYAGAEVVELAGLDEGALDVILSEIADRPLPAGVAATIHELTGGHPLFAREIYRHVAEEDRLGSDRLPTATELPATLEATIAWRMSRLGLETRSALNALACFGQGATPGLLAQVTGMSRARVVEVIERAVSNGLVRRADNGQRYVVYHDGVRRILLAATPARVKSAVHQRAAEALETEFGEDTRAHASLIVDHIVRASGTAAGGESQSVRLLLVAAEQARTASAYRRAATCVGHALTAFGEGHRTDYVELAARRALTQAEADLTDAAVASIRDLLAGQKRHGSLTREAWEDVVAAIRTVRIGGRIGVAAQVARTALDEGAPRDELVRRRLKLLTEEWTARETAGLAHGVWRVDDSEAPAMLIEKGDEQDRADVYLPQRPRTAADTARLTADLARWHRPAGVLRGLRAVTVDHLTRLGNFGEATTVAGRYLASAERFGSLRDVCFALLLLCRARAALGELEAATQILAAADEVLTRIPEHGELVAERMLSELVVAHYIDGDWSSLVERSAAVRAEAAHPSSLALAAEEAIGDVRAGRQPEARERIVALLESVTDTAPLIYYRDSALFGALTAAWELGAAEHAFAGRLLVERAAGAGVGGSHTATPRLALARLHGLSGNVADARDEFAKERTRLDAVRMQPLRAILDYDEAITIAAGGTGFAEAGGLLEGAFRQFQGLGMLGWAHRAEELQASGFEAAAQPGGRLHFSYPVGLSRREADIVRLLVGGTTPAAAAAELEIDDAVFDRHLSAALEKLGAANVDELPRFARRHGLGGA